MGDQLEDFVRRGQAAQVTADKLTMAQEGDIVQRARMMAERAHAGQVRKYTGEPYIYHPREVVGLVELAQLPPAVLAAAWLHDVIEDCGITAEQIREAISPMVAALVLQVTDISKPSDGNREVRKRLDRDHLAQASSWGMSIKLADIISNTSSIVERDPSFAKVYLAEKRELLPLLTAGNRWLWELAAEKIGVPENTKSAPGAAGGRDAGGA